MPEAARIGDEIAHSQANLGFWAGSIAAAVFEGVAAYGLGAALAGMACAFPVGTIAAIGIGLVVGIFVIGPIGDFIQSAGEALGRTFTEVTGALLGIGSTNIQINNRPAVRASPVMDYALCSKHSNPPVFVNEGATTVWFNSLRASRKGDAMFCDAKISSGSDNVIIGSPPFSVGAKTSQEISDTERKMAGYLRLAAGALGGGLAGGGGTRCVIMNTLVGIAVGLGASQALGDVIPHMDYGANAGNKAGTALGNWVQGKPVHVPTGAKILPDEIDVGLPGAFPLIWSRFYNSMDGRTGLLGQGWSTPLAIEIVFKDGRLSFFGLQGKETFFPDLEPDQSLYYIAEQLKITRSTGGHYYASYIGQDTIYYFGARTTHLDGERLPVRRVMDLLDNGLDFHYNDDGLPVEIVASSGHVLSLHYGYLGASPAGDQALDRHQARLAEIRQLPADRGPGASTTLVRYRYSSQGDLIAVHNQAGTVVRQFAYEQHMMVWQQWATGLESRYQWDQLSAKGRVIRQQSSDGEVLTFEYDDSPLQSGDVIDGILPAFHERQVRVTDQLGRVQQFTCNRHYLVTRYVDPLGAVALNEWDDNQRLTRMVDPQGRSCSFGYNSRAQLTSIRNPLGQTATVQWHSKFARIERVTRYDGSTWRYDYDDLGCMVQVQGPQGYAEQITVDERGLPVVHRDAKGGQVHLSYNQHAQLIQYTDCSQRSTHYKYDPQGRLATITNAQGLSQHYVRDAEGRVVELQLPDGARHRYQHDAIGQLQTYIDPLGRHTQYHRNQRGEVIAKDNPAGGRVTVGLDAAFRVNVLVNENQRAFRFQYDDADRLIEEHRVDGTRLQFEHNASGEVIAVIQHSNAGHDVFSDIEREARDRKNALGGPSGFGELPAGSASSAPAAPAQIRTDLIRDALGRLTEKRTATHHHRYSYDAAGRLVLASKFLVLGFAPAATTPVGIDPATAPQRNAASLSYELKPLHTTRFEYDLLGQLVAEHATDETTGHTHTLRHQHDALGNRTQTVLPALQGAPERALNYLHYGSGHLHQINFSEQAVLPDGAPIEELHAPHHHVIVDMERDSMHREVRRTQGALSTQYAYDALGRRTGVWTRAGLFGHEAPSRTTGQPGNNGAFAQALAFPQAQDGLLKRYQYDPVGELLQRQHSQQGVLNYQYDALGRLQSSQRLNRQGAAANELFDYDPAGNLLDPAQQHVQGNAAYDPNTPLAQRGQLNDNLVRVFEDKRYFYDGYSRLIEKRIARHTVQRFEWDDEHRLVAVHTTRLGYPAEQLPPTQVSQTTRFEYDALGRRVAKVDSFGRTDFIWEGMRLIEERRGAQVTSYVYEPGSYVPLARLDAQGQDTQAGGLQTQAAQPLAQEAANSPGMQAVMNNPMGKPGAPQANNGPSSTQIYHFHTDQSGLPEELSDHSGRIRWRAAYKAWGNTLTEQWTCLTISGHDYKANDQDPQAQASTLPQNLRFQGQYLDRDTGLHYNTFRFYDPDIGRFISPDPIGLHGGLNLHAYGNNPVSWIDPWGWAAEFGAKPPNSPDPAKWVAKGGTISVDAKTGTWTYTNAQGTSVSYPNGYPDFSPHAKQNVEVPDLQGNHGKSPGGDFGKADAAAKAAGGTGADYKNNTWHHHENATTMQEVPKSIHNEFTHKGGVSNIKAPKSC